MATVSPPSLFSSDPHDWPPVWMPQEVAKILRVGKNCIYELIRSGRLYAVQLGHTFRIPKAEVLRLLGAADTAEDAVYAVASPDRGHESPFAHKIWQPPQLSQ